MMQSPQQWGLPADASPAALSSRRLELLPGLAQLAVALPRDGGATAALQSLCSLQEAQDLASSTVAGLLKAALQVRVMVVGSMPCSSTVDGWATAALQVGVGGCEMLRVLWRAWHVLAVLCSNV